MDQDQEHLRLLSIFHYVVGGITTLLACFPLIHVAVGVALVIGAFPVQPGHHAPPNLFGWLFIVFGAACAVAGWSLAVAIVVAGRFLARRTHHAYCLVVAAIECILIPFGTILGVLTIIVLSRPSVRSLFQSHGVSEGSPTV